MKGFRERFEKQEFVLKLPLPMHRKLVRLKFKTEIDMSEHIRRAIDEYLQKHYPESNSEVLQSVV